MVNALACGQEEVGGVRLRRLGHAVPADGEVAFDAVLVSRLDCDVRFVDLPPVPEREVEGLLTYRLRSIYPGDPSETVFDYRLLGEGKQRQAVLLITRRETLRRYRAVAGGRPLLLPITMLDRIVQGRESVRVWFCAGEWLEHLVFRNGRPVSSAVRRADAADPLAVVHADGELPPEVRAIPALCVVERLGARTLPGGMEAVALATIAAGTRRSAGVFRGRRRDFLLSGAGLALLGAACAILAVAVLAKYVDRAERRVADLSTACAALEAESRRALAIRKEDEALEAAVVRMEAMRPRDVYASLSSLLDVLGEETQLVGLTLRDETFQVEAIGTNSLGLMERLRAHESFGEVRLSRVVPEAQSGRERFSFAGSFRVR